MKSFKRKLAVLLTVIPLSFPAIAVTFHETQVLANQGLAAAQNNLGVMYADGESVRQDYAQAVEWYVKAANQGLAAAQYNLGSKYHMGEGVRQNYAKAAEWYTKAANQVIQVLNIT